MAESKSILYFDMDGVLMDFGSEVETLGHSLAEYRRHEATNDFDEIHGRNFDNDEMNRNDTTRHP